LDLRRAIGKLQENQSDCRGIRENVKVLCY